MLALPPPAAAPYETFFWAHCGWLMHSQARAAAGARRLAWHTPPTAPNAPADTLHADAARFTRRACSLLSPGAGRARGRRLDRVRPAGGPLLPLPAVGLPGGGAAAGGRARAPGVGRAWHAARGGCRSGAAGPLEPLPPFGRRSHMLPTSRTPSFPVQGALLWWFGGWPAVMWGGVVRQVLVSEGRTPEEALAERRGGSRQERGRVEVARVERAAAATFTDRPAALQPAPPTDVARHLAGQQVCLGAAVGSWGWGVPLRQSGAREAGALKAGALAAVHTRAPRSSCVKPRC